MTSAWRLLVRQHGAPRTYTSTLQPDVFLNVPAYRNVMLPVCAEDRPVALFRTSLHPTTLLKVADLIAPRCEALLLHVDWVRQNSISTLPPAVKWDTVLQTVVQLRAQAALPVHCTLTATDDVRRTVSRAQDLVTAGCQTIVVSGTWAAAAAVRGAVDARVPVVVDGDFHVRADVARCMATTGAAGVIATEGLLADPALYSAERVRVYDIARAYMVLCRARLDAAVVASMRGHLAHMWHRVIPVVPRLAHLLAHANGLRDYDVAIDYLQAALDEMAANGTVGSGTIHDIRFSQPFFHPSSVGSLNRAPELKLAGVDWLSSYALPVSHSSSVKFDRMVLSKAKGETKRRALAANAAMAKSFVGGGVAADGANEQRGAPKLRRAVVLRNKMLAAPASDAQALRVAVDMSMERHMTDKEIRKTAKQLRHLYAINRRQDHPAHIFLTGLKIGGNLHTTCVARSPGFDNYVVTRTTAFHTEVFKQSELVYLTPDSPNPLTALSADKVYVLGGLVDEHILKNCTLNQANDAGIATARLPIAEHLHRDKAFNDRHTALAINQVFQVLVAAWRHASWAQALSDAIPKRKGFSPRIQEIK